MEIIIFIGFIAVIWLLRDIKDTLRDINDTLEGKWKDQLK